MSSDSSFSALEEELMFRITKRRLAVTGAALVVAAALGACASSTPANVGSTASATGASNTMPTPGSSPTSNPTAAQPAPAPIAPPTSSSSATGKTYSETADHIPFVQLWTNNQGSQASANLPYKTVVQVQCLAANESGMSSADPGFYKFVYNGVTYYAISNEFANGDPVGQPGSTTKDPAVPDC